MLINMETSLIVALAKQIAADTEVLDGYLSSNGLQIPGLDPIAGPTDFPQLPTEIQESRRRLLSNSARLQGLVRGPAETIRWATWGVRSSPSPNTVLIGPDVVLTWNV